MSPEFYAYLAFRLIIGDDVLDEFNEYAKADGFINESGEWVERDCTGAPIEDISDLN